MRSIFVKTRKHGRGCNQAYSTVRPRNFKDWGAVQGSQLDLNLCARNTERLGFGRKLEQSSLGGCLYEELPTTAPRW